MQPRYRGCRTAGAGHPPDVAAYATRPTPWHPGRGDNEQVSEDTRVPVRARLGQALAYVRRAEPRVPMSRRAVVTDILIAVLALVASLLLARASLQGSDLRIVPGPGKGQYHLQTVNSL